MDGITSLLAAFSVAPISLRDRLVHSSSPPSSWGRKSEVNLALSLKDRRPCNSYGARYRLQSGGLWTGAGALEGAGLGPGLALQGCNAPRFRRRAPLLVRLLCVNPGPGFILCLFCVPPFR